MITTPLEEIEAMALQLPASDRSHLAETLLSSLAEDDEVLAAWVEEAERRADAYDRGEIETVDFDDAIARARARIASRHAA
jgi:putative addiction module component (TIGR02574 family)